MNRRDTNSEIAACGRRPLTGVKNLMTGQRKRKASLVLQWGASVTVALMGVGGYALIGHYGFRWLPYWGFLLGLFGVLIIGGWGMWYLATHRQ